LPEAHANQFLDEAAEDAIPTAPSSVGLQDAIQERVFVSPCGGRFAPLPPEVFSSEGEWVEPGQLPQYDFLEADRPLVARLARGEFF
jgi:hypothetical protein